MQRIGSAAGASLLPRALASGRRVGGGGRTPTLPHALRAWERKRTEQAAREQTEQAAKMLTQHQSSMITPRDAADGIETVLAAAHVIT